MTFSSEEVQAVEQRYRDRIKAQRESIERLQELITQHEIREYQLKEGIAQKDRAIGRLTEDAAHLKYHCDGMTSIFCSHLDRAAKKDPTSGS